MRKINCELTKNLKDNHDMWVLVLQKEVAAAATLQKEQEHLNGAPEQPVVCRLSVVNVFQRSSGMKVCADDK